MKHSTTCRTCRGRGHIGNSSGDRFRALYVEGYPDVLRFALRRVHSSHAEDVAADTFLVALRRLDEAPRRRDDLRAWLFGIARHCLLNTQRGQGRRDALAVRIAEAMPTGGALDALDPDLIAQRLDLAIAWRQLSESGTRRRSGCVPDLRRVRWSQITGIEPACPAWEVGSPTHRRASTRCL